MSRPPGVVSFVARTHWAVSATIVVAMAVGFLLTRRMPLFTFGPRTYFITGGLAALYFCGGTLVWFGLPLGQLLSRICGLLYLARPQLGSRVWEMMNEPEFREHFARTEKTTESVTKDRE